MTMYIYVEYKSTLSDSVLVLMHKSVGATAVCEVCMSAVVISSISPCRWPFLSVFLSPLRFLALSLGNPPILALSFLAFHLVCMSDFVISSIAPCRWPVLSKSSSSTTGLSGRRRSVVECWTLNRQSPASNYLRCHFYVVGSLVLNYRQS